MSVPRSNCAAMTWRAGLLAGSGNIATHSVLSASRSRYSASQTVIFTMSSVVPPAAASTERTCVKTFADWGREIRGHLSAHRVSAGEDAGEEKRADPARRRNGIGVAEPVDVDTLARHRHGSGMTRFSIARVR